MTADTLSPSAISMTLADFTNSGLIIPYLRGRDAATVIQELSQLLQREKCVPDVLSFYLAALNREFLMSSDWESGMALPHARLPALKELSFALGRSDEPLRWGGKAVHAVRLVFLIAVPATDSIQYLSLISGLARLAREERLVQKLLAAQDTLTIIEVLTEIKLRTSPSCDLMKRAGA
jgi:mannitol/fructose-specific phosphotransferase system IIA component (Ntr-type)